MTGEVIRQLRLRSGLSQEELAYKMGYTDRSSISRIEKGDMPGSYYARDSCSRAWSRNRLFVLPR